MKNLIFTLFIGALAMTSAFGQKNTLLVGGNISINSTKTELGDRETTSSDVVIAPRVGYQFDDHWTAGVLASFGTNTSEDFDGDETEAINNRIGVFARYTQGISKTFAFYGDLDVGFQNEELTFNGNTGSESDGLFAQLTPALFINFKNSFGLNFSMGGIGFTSLENDDTDSKTSGFNFGFGRTFNLGISKNFDLGPKMKEVE